MMNTDISNIAREFSKGNFSEVYAHFHDNIRWHVIGNAAVEGKENVIAFCDKMTQEIGTAQLNNTRVIADGNAVAIEGNCQYTNATNQPAEVRYCDVYVFDGDKISNITSYCTDNVIAP